MRNNQIILALIFLLSVGFSTLSAQRNVSTAGGEASGDRGSASYSVGQVVYTTNSGNSGTVNQGVQQAYDIYVLSGLRGTNHIQLEISAFPNPTSDLLTLRIENLSRGINYIASMYDINGKLIEKQAVNSKEINLNISSYTSGNYFLKVTQDNEEIKVFKIVKN